jgi:hypothetical protein
MVTTQVNMHQAGDKLAGLSPMIVMDTLNQRRGAVSHTYNSYVDFTHS